MKAPRGHKRGVIMERCFILIGALKRHNGTTIKELAAELGVCERTAYRYIESASRQLPVWESLRRPARFKLLENQDFRGGCDGSDS